MTRRTSERTLPEATRQAVGRRSHEKGRKKEHAMMGWDGAGWGSGFWMLGGLLLVIGVILLVVWLATRSSRAGGTPAQGSSSPTPNQILSERFARGEITEQEFEQAKKALGPDR
ncbi:MAG: SHOCT domain-containing protein [Candidatus Limnocylindrales bacterium]